MNDAARVARRPDSGDASGVGEHARSAGERGDHQTVPGGQDLVVEMRTRTRPARREERARESGRARRRLRLATSPLRIATSSIDWAVYRRFLPVNSPCGSCGALPSGSIPNRRRAISASSPSSVADLLVGPDVERAFRLVRAGRARLFWRNAVGVLRGIEAALRDRSCRAERTAACLRRPPRRTRRRSPAPPRGTRARAATGRTASSRNAGPASRHRRNSDGSRRRCGRASRRAPSPEAFRSPSAAATLTIACVRRGARARAAGTAARDGRGNFGASPKPPRRRSKACWN